MPSQYISNLLGLSLPICLGTLPLVGTILWAMIQNNYRFTDMGKRIDDMGKRIDEMGTRIDEVRTTNTLQLHALQEIMNAKFEAQMQALLRVEGVLDARLKHLEER